VSYALFSATSIFQPVSVTNAIVLIVLVVKEARGTEQTKNGAFDKVPLF
jgi:hypothetical protein